MQAAVQPQRTLDESNVYVPDHVDPQRVHYFDVKKDPRIETDPFGTYLRLQQEAPDFFYSPAPYERTSGYWIFTRFDDIRYVMTHPADFGSYPAGLQQGERYGRKMNPLELGGAEHGKYRALVTGLLSPARVDAMEPAIRELCVQLVDEFKDRREIDFMYDFARELPIRFFMGLMGFPLERRADFKAWGDSVTHAKSLEEQKAANAKIVAYLESYLDERIAQPKDDFGSHLGQAIIDGQRISREDALDICYMLYLGGLDTVTSFLGHVWRHLAEHPQHRRRLAAEPARIPDAVEEFLRVYSIVSPKRNVNRDLEYKGVQFKKGDKLMMILNGASRDERRYGCPMDFDLERGARDHGGFGFGPHLCAGKVLARKEIKVSLEEFLRRIPEFSLKPGVTLTVETPADGVIGLQHLPLVLGN